MEKFLRDHNFLAVQEEQMRVGGLAGGRGGCVFDRVGAGVGGWGEPFRDRNWFQKVQQEQMRVVGRQGAAMISALIFIV